MINKFNFIFISADMSHLYLNVTPYTYNNIIIQNLISSCQDLAIFTLYTITSMFNVTLMCLVCMITLRMHAE